MEAMQQELEIAKSEVRARALIELEQDESPSIRGGGPLRMLCLKVQVHPKYAQLLLGLL